MPYTRTPPAPCTTYTQDVDPESLVATARVTMTTSGLLRTSYTKLLIPAGYVLNIAFNKWVPSRAGL